MAVDEIQENNETLVRDTDKLTDWVKEPTLELLKGDLEAAKPSHDNQLTKIAHWLDLLNVTGSVRPPKIRGRSAVQPKLIRRQAEWRYSALTEPFLGQEKLFRVYPRTFEDEEAAKQNELLLNWQFSTKINKIKLIDDFVRATVDEGTCILRLGWIRDTKVNTVERPVYEFYPVQDQMQLQQIQQALELKLSNPRGFNQLADEVKEAALYTEETGTPVVAVQVGSEQVEEEEIVENRPSVEVLDPANVYIDPSCQGDFSKALFTIVSFETNKADLIKSGRYVNLDKVDWEGATPLSEPDHESTTPTDFSFRDEPRKKVVAYEYWGYYDINDDGSLVPIVATWIGNTIIRMERNPFPDEALPFVVTQYLPVKRDLYGEPDAEVLEDNQRILGAVTRGMIDSLGRSANAQQGFAKGMLDALNRRRFENGEDYEFNPSINPQGGGLIEHKYPELPQSAMLMVQMQNQEAEALTGVKAFSGGLAGDAYNSKVATAIRGVLDAASKREMAILRRLARAITEVGNKIIAMNSEFLSEREVIRVTNRNFININREDLKGNFDLEVDIATAEVDNEKAQDMGFMLQTMGPNMDPQISMLILSEIADLKRMPALAEKLRNWKPQPDPMQEQAKQLELQKLQMEVAKLQAEVQKIQADAGLQGAKAEIEAANAQTNMYRLQSDMEKLSADADLTRAKADNERLKFIQEANGTAHRQNMEKMQAQAKGNQNLEITKALLKSRKPEETEPDVEAAIGYNAISGQVANGGRI